MWELVNLHVFALSTEAPDVLIGTLSNVYKKPVFVGLEQLSRCGNKLYRTRKNIYLTVRPLNG